MNEKRNKMKKIITITLLLASVGVLNKEFNNFKEKYTVNIAQSEYNHEEALAVETETLTTEDMESLFAEHDEIETIPKKTIENIHYTVKRGDTISALAKTYNIDTDYLIANNMELDLNILREGREIKIPSDKGFFYKIEEVDSFSTLEKNFNINKDIVQEDNALETLIPGETVFLREPQLATNFKAKITTFKKIIEKKNLQKLAASKKFYNPLNKVIITSSFGTRVHPVLKKVITHKAVDLKAAIGTKVLAAKDGVVKFAGYSGNYGYLVVITHKNGFETRYAHLSKIKVKVGQKINSREIIALSGKTGRVSGPHLHYEVRKNGKVLNPTRYMVFNK
ncbi:MAG: peptidoglycan DD-metalloendopeptidase family protein [Fusobacteriaceae bacterium]